MVLSESMTPHPDKTEFLLMSRKKFIGPLQSIKLGGSTIKQVKSTWCLGLQIDCNLNWNSHVSELILSFTQKLNLLKSLYFLPTNAKLDFYFKVVLPSINYGILVWGSCGKTLKKTSHRYELRDKITYVLPKPNTEHLKKSISYQAVSLWNSVDKELKSTNSLASSMLHQ